MYNIFLEKGIRISGMMVAYGRLVTIVSRFSITRSNKLVPNRMVLNGLGVLIGKMMKCWAACVSNKKLKFCYSNKCMMVWIEAGVYFSE